MQRLSFDECMKLKPGDKISIKCGRKYIESTVTRAPFWNSDADEKGYEIETNNGYSDLYSIYKKGGSEQ